MKKQKIIPLTVAIVIVLLACVLIMSKFFEVYWQNEEEINNTLDAEIVDNNENIFNYPYVTPEQAMENNRSVDLSGLIIAAKDNIDLPESDRITYQEAVNKVGEDIKYLTGFKNHSVQPVVAQIIYNNETENGFYIIKSIYPAETIDETRVTEFECNLDAKTGNYKQINIDYDFLHTEDSSGDIASGTLIIDDDTKNKINIFAKEIMSVLGYNRTSDLFNSHITGVKYDNPTIEDITFYTVNFAFICEEDVSVIVYMSLSELGDSEVYYPMYIHFGYN